MADRSMSGSEALLLGRPIAIIGLGYVGLPLALAFSKTSRAAHPVLGFDIDPSRVRELQNGLDRTGYASHDQLQTAAWQLTDAPDQLAHCQVFIVTVPTPVTEHKLPDLSPLQAACELLAPHLRRDSIVVFESTVYPGCSEEFCVPILQNGSGLTFNRDFFIGYSPERINPGDQHNTLQSIVKVTSGSTPEVADQIADLYRAIIPAGVFQAASIATAEASKVIENVQRDVNIALMNEFAQICHHLRLDSGAVLQAARSKWNFLDFRPGLVGGHCIGVDPYYLIHRSQRLGFDPRLISVARMVNESMPAHVVSDILKICAKKGVSAHGAKVLILGVAFKENCADVRNSRVFDIAQQFEEFASVQMYDPLVQAGQGVGQGVGQGADQGADRGNSLRVGQREYFLSDPTGEKFDIVVLAVPHRELVQICLANYQKWLKRPSVLYDVKRALPMEISDGRL